MNRLAQKRIKQSGLEVDLRIVSGEQLPFEDCCFDCVVSTFTLCSIEHVSQAIREVFRVLKSHGAFLFLEHGLGLEPGVQRWQRRLNWLQMRLADGCHLDRNIRELVAAQPFPSLKVDELYLENTPKTHGYLYSGIAVK
jgi:ubiquinone/menaquinone biosynthesis C-methylase UbiE